MKCGRCGEEGHNVKTCTNAPKTRVLPQGVSGEDLRPPPPKADNQKSKAVEIPRETQHEAEIVIRIRLHVEVET